MKIAFIGSRGIPANYGGFETFVEELSKELHRATDFEIVVVGDSEQQNKTKNITTYNGAKILYSKYSKQKNPFYFYLDSLFKVWDSEIIYSCGVGNAFFLFIPYLLGKKYVTNPDGIGWKRLKWSRVGKKVLKFMFFLSAKLSPYILADSIGIEKVFRINFKRGKRIETIEYGAYVNKTVGLDSIEINKVLEKYQLQKGKYHLLVSRLEPENNIGEIIKGYDQKSNKYPLIIVGDLQGTEYVSKLRNIKNKDICFLGGIYNKYELEVVRSNAFSYFHGHSVGGTNPSLLEAMASKNLCICHDNEFNRGVVKDNGLYFSTVNDVANIITDIEENDYSLLSENAYKQVKDYYNWESIGNRYVEYFKKISK
jgi:glycosyltransferase involved in cell wall biosynthesis